MQKAYNNVWTGYTKKTGKVLWTVNSKCCKTAQMQPNAQVSSTQQSSFSVIEDKTDPEASSNWK